MSEWDLNGVWTILGATAPTSGVSVAPIGVTVTAGEVLAGVDSMNQRQLLIPMFPGESCRTDKRGRGVHIGRLAQGRANYLTVVCLLSDLHPTFTRFCRELITTIASASSPAKEATLALDRWKTLFADTARPKPMSDESITGLVGELYIVEQLLDAGAPRDLGFWGGPLGDLHDFRSRSHAIEVKSTLVREGRIITISSLDQLQPPNKVELLLVHNRIEHDLSGNSLSEQVERVLEKGAILSELNRRLLKLGFGGVESLSLYDNSRFSIAESRTYDVEAIAFPRITRSCFKNDNPPPGTLKFSYAIDLTNEPPYPLQEAVAAAAVAALASEISSEVDS